MMASFRTLLSRSRGSARPASPPTRRRTFRPEMEGLEDRRTPAGSISGHVFVDQTGNGLTADDTPQSHVRVELYAETGTHERLLAVQLTGRDGAYSFNHLGAGRYFVVEAVPGGFVRTGPTTAPGYTVNLAAGQSVTGDDFDNFRVPDTDAVSRVTFTITNASGSRTVSDLRGQTHSGDTVTANFTVRKGEEPVVVSFAAYDAPAATFSAATASQQVLVGSTGGTFGPGTYHLTLQVPSSFYQVDFVAGPVIDHFGPAGSNIFYSAQHRLISADNGGTQPPPPAMLSGTVYVDNNQDGKLDAGDTGESGVTVTLTGKTAQGQTITLTTMTDSWGNYQFTGLAAGTYTVSAPAPSGFINETANTGALGGTPGLGGVANIVVPAGGSASGYDFAILVNNNFNA